MSSHQLAASLIHTSSPVHRPSQPLATFYLRLLPFDEAAEMASHLWYSPKLPSKVMAHLQPVFSDKFDEIFSRMSENPSSPPHILEAKFEFTELASVVALLPKLFWNKLKEMLDLKMNLSIPI